MKQERERGPESEDRRGLQALRPYENRMSNSDRRGMDDIGPMGGKIDRVVAADLLIVGTGIAGLTTALSASGLRVQLLTKTVLGDGSSAWAQGGIAAAMSEADSAAEHASDTLAAGAGLNDGGIVDILTREGPEAIQTLIERGARFDRDASGQLALGREAAHGRRRILHAQGDATGAEVVRALRIAARNAANLEIFEGAFAWDLARFEGRVIGATVLHADGSLCLHLAPAVVIAAGGLGQVYARTTNPAEVTGDGIAMAARAGARMVDMEFVQFHPTALASEPVPSPMPLVTEAVRGEGAILIDEMGRRFMPDLHPDAELAPRDVVARGIFAQIESGRQVFLDARHALGQRFPERFPSVFRFCQAAGIDPRTEPIPVSPAAHYAMGGIAVDEWGRSSVPGLWACGEATSSGAHGANRLASNSLLEGLVFGARVAEDVVRMSAAGVSASPHPLAPSPNGRGGGRRREVVAHGGGGTQADGLAIAGLQEGENGNGLEHVLDGIREDLREMMWQRVGLLRDAAGLSSALTRIEGLQAELDALDARPSRASGELRNLLSVGWLVAAAALARRESRGSHRRRDFPEMRPELARRMGVRLPEPALSIDLALDPAAAQRIRREV